MSINRERQVAKYSDESHFFQILYWKINHFDVHFNILC